MPLVLDRYYGAPPEQWTPPIGIPAPPFGIAEPTPTVPSPWTEALTGYYYVDNTSGAATDTSNPNGWPAQPRLTIPTTFAAGDVCFVHGGPYIYNVSGPDAFVASGTSGAPVFLVGVAADGVKPVIKGPGTWGQGYGNKEFQPNGSYYVIEGFRFSDGTTLDVLMKGDHLAFRHNEFVNKQTQPDGNGRQYGAVLNNGDGGTCSYVVIWDNVFRDNGQWQSTADNKVQGVKIGGITGTVGDHHIWIVDNQFYRNGQGMQHGDDCVGTIGAYGCTGACVIDETARPHHLYIGRNLIYDNREVGIALKMIADVIMSENEVYNHWTLPDGADCPSSPTPTAMNIGRFNSNRVWAIFNRVHDTVMAFRSNGQFDGVDQTCTVVPSTVYIVGNLIYNVDGTDDLCAPYSASDPNSTGVGVLGFQNSSVYVIDNTIAASPSTTAKGISLHSTGTYVVHGNLIANTGDPHLYLDSSAGTKTADYCFFDPAARIASGDVTPIISLATYQGTGQCAHSLEGDAELSASPEFRPSATSPAKAASVRHAVYDTFTSLYGLDIAVDITGAARPEGAWTMGAYEAG